MNNSNGGLSSRRRVLALGVWASLGRRSNAAAKEDFWNSRPPAKWSQEEIQRLLSRSPWAKEADSIFRPTTPGMGGGAGGRRQHGGGGQASQFKGIVCWESAKPILEARKAPLPESFADRYVISVTGIPLTGRPSADALDNLKVLTSLQAKGKDLLNAGVVEQRKAEGSQVLLFGFSRELLPISLTDKEVTFTTEIATLAVRAKFTVKEMLYHGELAI